MLNRYVSIDFLEQLQDLEKFTENLLAQLLACC